MTSKNTRFYAADDAKYQERIGNLYERALNESHITTTDKEMISSFIKTAAAIGKMSASRQNKLTLVLIKIRQFVPEYKSITFNDVVNALSAIKGNKPDGTPRYAHNTQVDYLHTLRRFLLWGCDNNYLNINRKQIESIKIPSYHYDNIKPTDLLSPDDVQKLIDAAKSARDRLLISMVYEGALRISEAAELRFGEVIRDGSTLSLHIKNSKTDRPRYVPLFDTIPYYDTYLNEYEGDKSDSAFLFTNSKQKSLQYTPLLKHLRCLCVKAGVKPIIGCHIFRHSRLTWLVQNNANVAALKKLAWNDNSCMLELAYTHLANRDLSEELMKFRRST